MLEERRRRDLLDHHESGRYDPRRSDLAALGSPLLLRAHAAAEVELPPFRPDSRHKHEGSICASNARSEHALPEATAAWAVAAQLEALQIELDRLAGVWMKANSSQKVRAVA